MVIKNSIYNVWTVFINENIRQYYVINRLTKRVQSVWTTFSSANKACYDLNQKSA